MCKWSDPFSKRVLIGRGLDHNSLETLKSQRKNVSSDYSVLKARPSKKYWTKYDRYVILVQSDRSVSMTVRFHLFPFRTQKLSSLVPKIVRWKRRVKIGSRRLEQKRFRRNSEAFFFCLATVLGENRKAGMLWKWCEHWRWNRLEEKGTISCRVKRKILWCVCALSIEQTKTLNKFMVARLCWPFGTTGPLYCNKTLTLQPL